jgi:hypothetical protein
MSKGSLAVSIPATPLLLRTPLSAPLDRSRPQSPRSHGKKVRGTPAWSACPAKTICAARTPHKQTRAMRRIPRKTTTRSVAPDLGRTPKRPSSKTPLRLACRSLAKVAQMFDL